MPAAPLSPAGGTTPPAGPTSAMGKMQGGPQVHSPSSYAVGSLARPSLGRAQTTNSTPVPVPVPVPMPIPPTPPTHHRHVSPPSPSPNLPPLPPMGYVGSPSFGPSGHGAGGAASKRYSHSSSNLLMDASPRGGLSRQVSIASPAGHATPLRMPMGGASPLLNFQPRPASPSAIPLPDLSLSGPNGTVCTCPNDPNNPVPCSCSVPGASTPVPLSRRLSQSTSLDAGFPAWGARSSSQGMAGGTRAPVAISHSPPPLMVHRRQPTPTQAPTASSPSAASSSLSSSTPGSSTGTSLASMSVAPSTSSSLASMGMAPPSSLPTSRGSVVINIYNGQPHQVSLGVPPAAPLSKHDPAVRRSMFSPSAPDNVLALLQRQASVSPATYSPSPHPAAAESLSSAPLAPAHTINISSLASPDMPTTSTTGLPLTASTLRLLRKAMDAVRSLFPPTAGDGQRAASAATSASCSPASSLPCTPAGAADSCCSPLASCAACMVRMRSSVHLWPLPESQADNPTPSPRAVDAPSTAVSPPGCTCFTRPLLCGCGYNLHVSRTAPNFIVDNPHLQLGYRGVLTPAECLRSLGQMHNESCNIWSHALGSVWMASLWRSCKGELPLQLPCVAGACLFACSAVAHCFAPVSANCNAQLFRIDRCSISLTETLIGISTALIHFDRPEQSRIRWGMGGLNALVGVFAFRALWNESPTQSRLLKIGVLMLQAGLIGFPVLREYRTSRDEPLRRLLQKYSLLAVATAGLGALFYASYWPERMVYQKEVDENARRHAKQAEASAAGATTTSKMHPAHSADALCAPRTPAAATGRSLVASTSAVTLSSSSSSSTSSPPIPPHLAASTYWRFLHWLTNHVLHSHHLMHISVVFATYFAWRLCAKWRGRKVELAILRAVAMATKAR